jgi:hypothetical protein
MTTSSPRSKTVETSDTIEVIEECYQMGWTDGLPVVPPADYKVREMLEYAGMTGEEELLSLEMRRRVLTSENAAANAVMAGCLPEYFPVLVSTLRALDEEKNFVHMAAASTSSPQHPDDCQRPHPAPDWHQLQRRHLWTRLPGQRLPGPGGPAVLHERI